MNKILLAGILALASAGASAQTTDGSAPPAPASPAPGARFDQVKQKHLDMISKRIERLQGIQQCVLAATDFAALRACEPQKGHGPRGANQSAPSPQQ